MKGLKLNVFAPSRYIVKQDVVQPNFWLDVDTFNLFVSFFNDQLNRSLIVQTNMSLNYIMMVDQAVQHYSRFTLTGNVEEIQ